MYRVQDSCALVAGHRALLRPRTASGRAIGAIVMLDRIGKGIAPPRATR